MIDPIAKPTDTPPIVPEKLRPDVRRAPSLAHDVERWLANRPHTEAAPDLPTVWHSAGARVPVGHQPQLTMLVASLGEPGRFGVLERGELWAQTMRTHDGWIIEVSGIPGPDCFARRVRFAAAPEHPTRDRMLVTGGDGSVRATLRRGETISPAVSVAAVMWQWVNGSLPEPFDLRALDEGD